MDFSDSSWQDFPDTDRSTGSYMIFYQDSPMDHETHVRVPVAQSSAESQYSVSFTVGMALANFRLLIHKLLLQYPNIVQEEAPIIILDRKSGVSMDNNDNNTKHTRHINRRVTSVRNDESEKPTGLNGVKDVNNWHTL